MAEVGTGNIGSKDVEEVRINCGLRWCGNNQEISCVKKLGAKVVNKWGGTLSFKTAIGVLGTSVPVSGPEVQMVAGRKWLQKNILSVCEALWFSLEAEQEFIKEIGWEEFTCVEPWVPGAPSEIWLVGGGKLDHSDKWAYLVAVMVWWW